MPLEFNLGDLAAATGGTILRGDPGALAPEISTDSRTLRPGAWFLALRGDNFDGHDYLVAARQRGAAGFIVSRNDIQWDAFAPGAPALRVDDALRAYGDIARAWRKRRNPRVAAIAGSGGKTTTREIAASVLRLRAAEALVSDRNFNNRIGVPQTLLQLTAAHRLALLELGMNQRGELAELARIADPEIAALTNIGNAHVGMFGSLDGLMDAKGELPASMRAGATLLLNRDCPRSVAVAAKRAAHLKIVEFGTGDGVAHQASRVETLRPWGRRFLWRHPGGSTTLEIHAFGRANVMNALCAAALLFELNFTPDEIARGVRAFRPSGMRSEARVVGGVALVEDCYNASPAAMEMALESMNDIEASRRRLVLGDMLELGADEETLHREIGAVAARVRDGVVYAIGPRAGWIAEAAAEAGAAARWFARAEDALEALKAELTAGDAVLVKASRGMKLETLAAGLREFLETRRQGLKCE